MQTIRSTSQQLITGNRRHGPTEVEDRDLGSDRKKKKFFMEFRPPKMDVTSNVQLRLPSNSNVLIPFLWQIRDFTEVGDNDTIIVR